MISSVPVRPASITRFTAIASPALLTEETTIVRTGGASDGTTPISWKIVTTANCNYSMPFECPPIAIWNDTTGSAVTATVEGIWGGGAVPNDDEVWLEVEYLGDAVLAARIVRQRRQGRSAGDRCRPDLEQRNLGRLDHQVQVGVTFTRAARGLDLCPREDARKASIDILIDPLVTLT